MGIFEDGADGGAFDAAAEPPYDGTARNEGMEGAHFLPTGSRGDLPGGDAPRGEPADSTKETLVPTERIYAVDDQGFIRPRDPLSGAILRPGEIAPSILDDPEIREGFAFWQAHGAAVDFRFLGTQHLTAEDLERSGIDLRAEALRLQETGGILFLEGYAPEELFRSAEELHRLAAGIPPELHEQYERILDTIVEESPDFGYGASVAKAIMGTHVQTSCVDFVLDGQRPTDKALSILHRAYNTAKDSQRTDRPQSERVQNLIGTLFSYDSYRNMQFVGRMGAVLARTQSRYADWLGGALHMPIGAYVEGQGATVSYAGQTNIFPFNRRMIDCVRRGEISQTDVMGMLVSLIHTD